MSHRTHHKPATLLKSKPKRRRENKLRASWFILGSLFGTLCMAAIGSATAPRFTEMQLKALEDPAGFIQGLTSTVGKGLSSIELHTQGQELRELTRNDAILSYPATLAFTVKKGDQLGSMLTRRGVSDDEADHILDRMKPTFDPRKLPVGSSVTLVLDKDEDKEEAEPFVQSLLVTTSAISSLELKRRGEDFAVREIKEPLMDVYARAGGAITSSLYETAVDSGLPPALLQDVINAYSYDIDFQRDVKSGHSIDILFERKQTKSGIIAGYGQVIYASLNLGDRVIDIYRYTDNSGFSTFYTAKGDSIRKALLKTPINGARVSSGFGMRMHPILGYSTMHRGMDFAAGMGTPVYAAGDGVVEYAGRKGAYGNYLRISHNNKYDTAYGHLSRFAKGVVPGKRVKQGQVVAYVGNTGRSTGPHLHYEILANGEQINPSGVKFKTGQSLQGKELADFKQKVSAIQSTLAGLPRLKTQVADAPAAQN